MAGAADDRRLLDSYLAQRSHDAFAELARRYTRLVYGYALRKTRDAAMAEDVTQTVFALLARKADSARRRPLSGWLFAATRYAAANELRAAARRRRHERAAAKPEATAPAVVMARVGPNGHARECHLDDALAALRPSDREVLLLRYFDGLDGASLAAALEVSEQAASRRLGRALVRLRRAMGVAAATLSPAALETAFSPAAAPDTALAQRVARAAMAPNPSRLRAVRALAGSMRRARAKLLVTLMGAVLFIPGGALVARSLVRGHGTSRAAAVLQPVRPRRPGLKLTLAWNGTEYTVPMPPTFPDELRDTAPYRDWLATGDVRTFEWTTHDGRRYVCSAGIRDVDGRSTALVSRVRLFRTDGTLQAETTNDDRGQPRSWDLYEADGRTLQVSLTNCPAEAPGAPYVQTVRFHRPGGGREFDADRNGTVYAEWMLDANGHRVRLLNGRGRNDDAVR